MKKIALLLTAALIPAVLISCKAKKEETAAPVENKNAMDAPVEYVETLQKSVEKAGKAQDAANQKMEENAAEMQKTMQDIDSGE